MFDKLILESDDHSRSSKPNNFFNYSLCGFYDPIQVGWSTVILYQSQSAKNELKIPLGWNPSQRSIISLGSLFYR